MLPERGPRLTLSDCELLDTIQQRQAAKCAKFSIGRRTIHCLFRRACRRAWLLVEIETYSAFRVDINTVEQPLYDSAQDYAQDGGLPIAIRWFTFAPTPRTPTNRSRPVGQRRSLNVHPHVCASAHHPDGLNILIRARSGQAVS